MFKNFSRMITYSTVVKKKVRRLKVAVCSKQNSLSTDKSQTNPLPGSFSAAFAQSEDCGHVLVTLPGASAPRSRAGEERADKNEKRKQLVFC